jgi:hypothetical protein
MSIFWRLTRRVINGAEPIVKLFHAFEGARSLTVFELLKKIFGHHFPCDRS